MKLSIEELELLIGILDYCNFEDAEPAEKQKAESLREKVEKELEERQQSISKDYDMRTHLGRQHTYNALLGI